MDKCLICESGDLADIVLNNLEMKKCRKCGLVWLKKMDVSEEHYRIKKTNPGLKADLETSNALDRIKQFKNKISLNNLCDIGCGSGTFLKVLKSKGYKNIIGIEPNIDSLNYSKDNGLDIFHGGIKDFEKIAKNKNIQTVAMFTVIEHLKNPFKSLKMVYNGLSKGGRLVVVTPDMDCYSFKKTDYQHKSIHSEHFFYFNKSNLKKLLEKAGFKIKSSGKKEFDLKNLGIKELFFRVGLGKKPKGLISENGLGVSGSSIISKRNNLPVKIVKSIIRFILLKMVVLLGRLEFIWVIAEK